MEEFLAQLCAFDVNRSSRGTSKSKVSLSLAKAIDGFLKFKTAEGLSQRTITSYEFTLGHWLNYIGDQEVSDIHSSDLTGYMAWLRTEYKPRRWNGSSEFRITVKETGFPNCIIVWVSCPCQFLTEILSGRHATAILMGSNNDLALLLPGDNAVHFFAQVLVFVNIHMILLCFFLWVEWGGAEKVDTS